jgi:DNA-binding NtrC family response regulator
VADGKFREDLFHRLNGVTLLIPPLRERLEELPALIATELKASAAREGKKIRAIHPEAMARLLAHDWRGNLRELSHTVHTMTLFCEGGVILPENVIFSADLPESSRRPTETKTPDGAGDAPGQDLSLSSALTRHVQFVFARANRNQRLTAKLLGISRSTLARHLQNVSHLEANGSISNPVLDSN